MFFKYSLLPLLAILMVSAAPHGDDHGHGATSHASFHLVSDGGHDEGHGHEHGHDHGHDDGGKYHFSYGVDDHKTGDHHSQSEKRDGHHVEGHYELLDADGHKRIVHYFANKHSGFHATVNRVPSHHKPQESHTSHHGGHVIKFTENHSESHDHGHEHGHSEDGYEIKQDHGHTVHHHHSHQGHF